MVEVVDEVVEEEVEVEVEEVEADVVEVEVEVEVDEVEAVVVVFRNLMCIILSIKISTTKTVRPFFSSEQAHHHPRRLRPYPT